MYNGSAWTNIVGGVSNSGTVTMCNQTWMINNLNVSTYRNGDIIPQVTNSLTWGALSTGAWCWYNNDSATYASTYGKLYNWYAVTDVRGLAPAGWHVPSDSEWTILESCLGGGSIAGGKMKETGTIHWLSPNTGATNSSGFTGLPGGTRYNDGVFNLINNYGFWWSTTPNAAIDAYFRFLVYNNGTVTRANFAKPDGFSVRCVRD